MATTNDNSLIRLGILKYFYNKLMTKINNSLSKKVDVQDGKGLSSNDFTDEDKEKLDGIATGANRYVLPEATSNSLGGVKLGYEQNGKNYPIVKDSNGNIYVAVPWQDTKYSLPSATNSALGGIKTGYKGSGKNYAVLLDTSGNAYVSVPWTDTDTKYNLASETSNGLLKMLDGNTSHFMRGDGTWASVDTATYSIATESADGLMSKQMVQQLNELYTWMNGVKDGSEAVLIKRSGS